MESSKVIVTVIGEDKVGIIAAVSSTLAENQINILDITQTIMQGFFTMIMVVDISKGKIGIMELQDVLEELGRRIGMRIQAQHEDIFRYMHRI